MIIFDKYDSQIILLAKGHFGFKNVQERDKLLKILIAHRNLLEVKYVNEESIYYALTQILDKCNLKEQLFGKMCRILFGVKLLDRETPFERFTDACIGLLSCLQIKDRENTLVQLEPLDLSLVKPKGFVRLDDGERFTLNKDGITYSLEKSKEQFPDNYHTEYTESMLSNGNLFEPYWF